MLLTVVIDIIIGFSFGGLLASAIAASVWDAPFISSDLLKENMTCITFGQPHVKIEVIQSVADRRPEMVSTFHLIYHEHDHIPSILSLLDECWSAKIQKQQQNEGTVGMQLPLVVAANAVSIYYKCMHAHNYAKPSPLSQSVLVIGSNIWQAYDISAYMASPTLIVRLHVHTDIYIPEW